MEFIGELLITLARIFAAVGALFAVIGMPAAFILFIVVFMQKDRTQRKKYYSWIGIVVIAPIILLTTAILMAVLGNMLA